jgi:hypothetical protein
MITALGPIETVFEEADPRDKAAISQQLDLRLTYQPATRTVRAETNLVPAGRGVMGRVRGPIQPTTPRLVLTAEFLLG